MLPPAGLQESMFKAIGVIVIMSIFYIQSVETSMLLESLLKLQCIRFTLISSCNTRVMYASINNIMHMILYERIFTLKPLKLQEKTK